MAQRIFDVENEKEENPQDFTIMSERMEELAKQSKEFLGDNNE